MLTGSLVINQSFKISSIVWLSEPRGSGFGGKGIQCLRRQLKCIRSDNCGEYRGPFEDYCRTHGIRLEKSMPKPLSTMEWQRE